MLGAHRRLALHALWTGLHDAFPSQAAWRCAVDLQALAACEGDAALLVGVLLRRRHSAHPSTDICALATGVIKVHRSSAVLI